MPIDIVMIPVNEIIPYWRNPRRNDKTVDALCETIPVHGFNVPIVVDKNNVVVKGHARLKAAKRLGMEAVPCIVSDAPEDVIKADRIADNKIQELSAWDFGKLNFELANHDTPVFNRLFRPEEAQVSTDAVIAEAQFSPVGLYDFGEMDASEDAPAPTSEPYEMPAWDGQVNSSQEQAFDSEPQKPRQAKTLCPYCGKVVMVTL